MRTWGRRARRAAAVGVLAAGIVTATGAVAGAAVQAQGPMISVSPSPIDFGILAQDAAGNAQSSVTLTITNITSNTIGFYGWGPTGGNGNGIALASCVGPNTEAVTILAAGATCTAVITFTYDGPTALRPVNLSQWQAVWPVMSACADPCVSAVNTPIPLAGTLEPASYNPGGGSGGGGGSGSGGGGSGGGFPAGVQAAQPCTAMPSGTVTAMAATPDNQGYWIVDQAGQVDACGDAPASYGELSAAPARPVVGIAPVPGGYWLVGSDGGVFSFGSAQFYGSLPGLPASDQPGVPVLGIAAPPDGGGYWEVTSLGDIYSFGDAQFYGSTGHIHLNQPIVGITPVPDGGGYWLVAADGGVFAFGSAQFYGSLPGLPASVQPGLPVVAMAGSAGGYWESTSGGDIYSFGQAPFYGSTGHIALARPIVAMQSTAGGYRLLASDGGVFCFGDAGFYGSAA